MKSDSELACILKNDAKTTVSQEVKDSLWKKIEANLNVPIKRKGISTDNKPD